jgi:hypothetical protein
LVQEGRTHCAMMFGRMVFGVVVGEIFGAWAPLDQTLFLMNAVLYPVKAHVHGF